MLDQDRLAVRFEEHRPHLRAVAYRLLGSLGEADDAIQDAWLRASRAGAEDVVNLGGWLTTIVTRVCLNLLEARRARREEPLDVPLPEPVLGRVETGDPEGEALLADALGPALLVILATLTPAERVAFVLHDVFAVPFAAIAPIIGGAPGAARQLASRARRRVREGQPRIVGDRAHERQLIAAFLDAARGGDFAALLEVLDPAVVLRTDRPGAPAILRGAEEVAAGARLGAGQATTVQPVRVNGRAGIVARVPRDSRLPCSASRLRAGGSSRSTSMPILRDWPGSICAHSTREMGGRHPRAPAARPRSGLAAPERADLDEPVADDGDAGRPGERGVEIGHVDDVDAAELLPGGGMRPVRYLRHPVRDAHGLRGGARLGAIVADEAVGLPQRRPEGGERGDLALPLVRQERVPSGFVHEWQ